MRPSPPSHHLSARDLAASTLALATSLAVGTMAHAAVVQPTATSPAPVAEQPAPPPPQGAFPPPPPRFEGQAAPVGGPLSSADDLPWGPTVAAQAGARDAEIRRFFFTAALGPGTLIGPGEEALAMAYHLSLGVGLAPNLALVFGFAGTGTSSVNPATMNDSWLKQDLWSLGLQANLLPRLYLRGAMGVGMVSESVGSQTFEGGRGLAVVGAVGYELLQRRHVALAVELNGSLTHYPSESWRTAGLQVSVSLF